MTRQMSRGSQVAFAKAWLERKGIEAQTVDIHSLIDSSLSYEENIKNVKSYLGMGGRSEKKATRTLSAAECDVAIGNCQAGFVEDCKDACECGDPDACDVAGEAVSTPPTKKPASAPKFKTVKTTKPKPASIPTIVSAEATPEMRDALTSAITEGFSGAPKRTTASRAEAEFAATALEWGKGKSMKTVPKKKTAKPKKSAARKTTKSKTTTKPAKAKARKPKATQKADIKLTAAQRKRLNATGHVTVKRGGKFITITNSRQGSPSPLGWGS